MVAALVIFTTVYLVVFGFFWLTDNSSWFWHPRTPDPRRNKRRSPAIAIVSIAAFGAAFWVFAAESQNDKDPIFFLMMFAIFALFGIAVLAVILWGASRLPVKALNKWQERFGIPEDSAQFISVLTLGLGQTTYKILGMNTRDAVISRLLISVAVGAVVFFLLLRMKPRFKNAIVLSWATVILMYGLGVFDLTETLILAFGFIIWSDWWNKKSLENRELPPNPEQQPSNPEPPPPS